MFISPHKVVSSILQSQSSSDEIACDPGSGEVEAVLRGAGSGGNTG